MLILYPVYQGERFNSGAPYHSDDICSERNKITAGVYET